MSNNDQANVMEQNFKELLQKLSTIISSEEKARIEKAFHVAKLNYQNRFFSSGKPYLWHHVEVAHIAVTELGLRAPTVIASLLHGIEIKDEAHFAQIVETYGSDAAVIIKGFQKISALPTDRISFHSEQFRKLFLSFVDDIRVILLKIAHRLCDLRHPDERGDVSIEKFILEVKHIYVPITHRLGLYTIKAEFEERIMKFENPEVFDSIKEKIAANKEKQEIFMRKFIQPIENELIAHGLKATIKWRTKSIPSIWEKMKSQNVEFEEVFDLFAIRIITKSTSKKEKEDCWRAYSIVTDRYVPNPQRLRDWITTPKASGYESLHTTVKAAENKWIEVQIRSERMDVLAERGQAAHWLYKDKLDQSGADEWLNQVRDVLENPNQLKFGVYKRGSTDQTNKIYIFTPDGDLKQLTGGSTVLDFAYEVHTKIGDSCTGGIVNGNNVSIRHVLQNGDKVHILTSKKQTPKRDWLSFVVSVRARNKINHFLKEEELKEAAFGRETLLRKIKNWKIQYTENNINQLVKYYKLSTPARLYHLIAIGKLDLLDLKKVLIALCSDEKPALVSNQNIAVQTKQKKIKESKDDFLIIDSSLSHINYKLAKCCNPIPGDKVFGFVTISTGITVHKYSCPNANRLKGRYDYRVVKVKWREKIESSSFLATILINGTDAIGLVGDITKLISNELKVNMKNLAFNSKDGKFVGRITVQIKDSQHVDHLIKIIAQVPGVAQVSRLD